MSLNVAILSSSAKVGSTKRLKECLNARGHKVRILLPEDLRIFVKQDEPVLLHKGKELKKPDALIPRIGSSKTFIGTALVLQFERMGVFTLNSAQAIGVSRNKLRALQKLSRNGVGLPETVFLSSRGNVVDAVRQVGGAPVIIKLLEGTQGIGVMLADTEDGATAILETLRKTKQDVLVQRFVAESRGRDVRALVVGGKVVAAVRRVAQGDEFRSNVHRGSTPEAIQIDAAYAETAVKAAQILGLAVAGVDMLEGVDGPLVVEVNSSPSISGMEECVGFDLATPLIEYLEDHVHLRPFDVTQRLTIRQGYGVSEVPVTKASPLAGKSLEQIDLGARGLKPLCVLRGDAVHDDLREWTLEVGDRLTLFGKLREIRDLLPTRGPERPPRVRKTGSTEADSPES